MKFKVGEQGVSTELDFGTLTISGDETKGYRPFQLMVSSIASCSGFVFRRVLEKQRLTIDDLTIKATVKRNEQKSNRLEEIHLTFLVKGEDLEQERLERNLKISSRNCAMVQSVKDSIKVIETVEIVS